MLSQHIAVIYLATFLVSITNWLTDFLIIVNYFVQEYIYICKSVSFIFNKACSTRLNSHPYNSHPIQHRFYYIDKGHLIYIRKIRIVTVLCGGNISKHPPGLQALNLLVYAFLVSYLPSYPTFKWAGLGR